MLLYNNTDNSIPMNIGESVYMCIYIYIYIEYIL